MSESVGTYSQIHLHLIFAVKFRDALLHPTFEDEIFRYITGIIQNNKHKLIAINGMPDHIHIFVGMRPHQSVSDLVSDIKANSSKFINERKFLPVRFEWQRGYGVFSYGKSQVKDVVNYVMDQKRHHQKLSFRQEYEAFLKKFEVEYDEKYLFNELI